MRPQHQRDNFVSIPPKSVDSGRRMVTVALRGFKRDVTPAPTDHGEDSTPSSTTPLSELLQCSTTVGKDVDALRLSRDQLGAWLRVGMGRKPLLVFGCNVLSYYLSVSVLPYSCRTSVKRRLANPRTPTAYRLASSRSDTLCRTALEIACVKPIARLRQPSVSLL